MQKIFTEKELQQIENWLIENNFELIEDYEIPDCEEFKQLKTYRLETDIYNTIEVTFFEGIENIVSIHEYENKHNYTSCKTTRIKYGVDTVIEILEKILSRKE